MHHTSECGCGHHAHAGHGMGGHHHGGCCSGPGVSRRHFFTQEEIIEHLEEYLKQLQAEAKGVEEHIKRLKNGEIKH